MSLPEITMAPDAPQPTDAPAVFNAKAFAFIAWLATLSGQLNTLSDAYEAFLNASFGATSTTSLAIATGSKAFTIGEGAAFVIGQPVKATSAASVANWMAGTIESYSGGVLTIDVTETGGSGTHADWEIGLLPLADLSGYLELAGGTMIGLLITLASASGGAGFRLSPGSAPSSPTNGDVWLTSSGIFARVNGATLQLASLAGAETFTNKTFTGYTESTIAPSAESSFSPDLSTGTVFNYTTNDNATLTLPTAVAGQSFSVRIAYGGTHTLTLAGETVEWSDGGDEPDWSSASGTADTIAFVCYIAGLWTGYPNVGFA